MANLVIFDSYMYQQSKKFEIEKREKGREREIKREREIEIATQTNRRTWRDRERERIIYISNKENSYKIQICIPLNRSFLLERIYQPVECKFVPPYYMYIYAKLAMDRYDSEV